MTLQATEDRLILDTDFSVFNNKVQPKYLICTIVSVGPGSWNYEETKRKQTEYKVGNKILLRNNNTEDYIFETPDGTKYIVAPHNEPIAIIK